MAKFRVHQKNQKTERFHGLYFLTDTTNLDQNLDIPSDKYQKIVAQTDTLIRLFTVSGFALDGSHAQIPDQSSTE